MRTCSLLIYHVQPDEAVAHMHAYIHISIQNVSGGVKRHVKGTLERYEKPSKREKWSAAFLRSPCSALARGQGGFAGT